MRRELHKRRYIQSLFATVLAVSGVFAFSHVVSAAAVNLGLTPEVGKALGLGTQDIRVTIAVIIRNFIGLLGIVAVVLMLYGGFLWMTSGGEEDVINKAKRVIVNAAIGLGIILSALAITQFILSRLSEATGLFVTTPSKPGDAYIPKSGALGQGIIESHYPERGQTDVARNSYIVITFKEEMDISTIIAGYDVNNATSSTMHDLRNDLIKIYTQADGVAGAFKSTDVKVYYTPDHKTFVFHPPLLGSPTINVPYLVDLSGGGGGLHKMVKGASVAAFDGAFATGYQWDFTTGTFIDLTPPQIDSVIPYPSSTNPRNVLIQINFSEPVDPTTVVGMLPAFKNIEVRNGGEQGALVAGGFGIGNRYRTIEYTSTDLCGKNACGGDVYCLPSNADMFVKAHAASLGPNPPQADPVIIPSDGVTDMVGNSLDGNRNGTAQGPESQSKKPAYNENTPNQTTQGDDYAWSFKTSDVIDITPPVIVSTDPEVNTPSVLPDKPATVVFSKLMSLLSFNSTNVSLIALAVKPPPGPTCYSLSGNNLDKNGQIATSTPAVASQLILNHCLYFADTNYVPTITSKLIDLYQNCYYPGARTQNAMTNCDPQGMEKGGYKYCCNGAPCAKACVPNGLTVSCGL